MAQGTHGTYRMHAAPHRCRCAECCAYQNERVARNRASRMETGNLNHGTRSAYDAGCKCEGCRMARRNAYVENEQKKEPEAPKHNHMTRDIKPVGLCPACDWFAHGTEASK